MEHPDLIQKSRGLTKVSLEEWHAWISPDELLILRPAKITPDSPNETAEVAVERVAKTTYTAHRFDLATGQETPLEEFNRKHSAELLANVMHVTYGARWEAVPIPPRADLSSDGKWLLWQSRNTWRVARLDGDASVTGSVNNHESQAVWLPGNRRWLETESHYANSNHTVPALWLRRRNDSDYKRHITVANLPDGIITGITPRTSLVMCHPGPPSRTDTPRQRAVWEEARDGAAIVFSEVDLRHPRARARPFAIPLPIPGSAWFAHLAPAGNRLALIIQTPPEKKHPLGKFYLWTCDLDGGAGEIVGWAVSRSIKSQSSPNNEQFSFPHHHRWSPDGKHITFSWGEELRVVSVR